MPTSPAFAAVGPDRDVLFGDRPVPAFKPLSLLAQMLQAVVYRGERPIVICRECGNAVLGDGEGRPKQYCSNKCKLRHTRSRASVV